MNATATRTGPSATLERPTGGTFIWYELMTDDAPAAEAFYGAVIGWDVADSGLPGMRYAIVSADGHGVGGIMALPDAAREAGARPGWHGYVQVDDVDRMAERIVAAGGAVHRAPEDIESVGRFAVVADPGGAVFHLLAPTPTGAMPASPDPQSVGLVSWRELYSSAGEEAAFAFYSGLFGWETISAMDMGAMGSYRIFGKDGVQMGGMMDKPGTVPRSTWAFYVNVDSIVAAAARIEAHGGRVLMGPHEVPGGSWVVQAVDPQGASFALVSTER